jgi:uncharacterized protein YndB with AHSA1/START domain
MIEVTVEIEIAAEPTSVAAVMFDPHREPEWLEGVKTIEVLDPGIRPGARVRRTGTFHGYEVAWSTEVVAFQFPHLLELRFADGPLNGRIAYHVGRSTTGSVARIAGAADPGPLAFLPAPMIAGPARSALSAALARLKAIVEAAG